MIELKHLNISFHDKEIFKDASFSAKVNELTVVAGKSGIGKSTLLQTLLFQYPCSYFFKSQDLSHMDDQQQSEFISKYVGIVFQEPLFINDLTIQQHIDYIVDVYQLEDCKNQLIQLFQLEELLNKYPLQLSGGEKMRAGIYLSVLKDPYILILDEPSASLDDKNKRIIIQFLKNYAREGHIVIVASHDDELINEADCLFMIENQRINLIHHNEIVKNSDHIQTFQMKECSSMFHLFRQMNKHHALMNKLLLTLLSLSIAFVFISISLNNVIIDKTKEYLNDFSSRELIIYQSFYESRKYTFDGSEFPIEESLIKEIEKIDGVESVNWRFDISLGNENYLVSDNGDDHYANQVITSYEDKQELKSIDFKETNSLLIHTYIDDFDYSNEISKNFYDEGIYVSPALYNALFNDEVTQPELAFELPVPIYNSSGISNIFDLEDNDQSTPCNRITCKPVNIQLPIKGVTKGNVLSQEDSAYAYHIYISQSYLNSLINQYREESNRTVYGNYHTQVKYINQKPSDYTPEDYHVTQQTPWQPVGYSVILSDLTQLENVVDQIQKLGLTVDSHYFDASTILQVKEETKTMSTMISTIIMIIVLIIYFVVQYTRHDQIKETSKFLKYLGNNEIMIRKFHSKMNLYHTYELFICSLIVYLGIRLILEKLLIAFIQIDLTIFMMMFIFVFVIEYGFRFVLMKVNNK